MDLTFIIVVFAIGFIGSFLSGMLGVGVPLLNTQCYFIFPLYLV